MEMTHFCFFHSLLYLHTAILTHFLWKIFKDKICHFVSIPQTKLTSTSDFRYFPILISRSKSFPFWYEVITSMENRSRATCLPAPFPYISPAAWHMSLSKNRVCYLATRRGSSDFFSSCTWSCPPIHKLWFRWHLKKLTSSTTACSCSQREEAEFWTINYRYLILMPGA